MFYRLLSVCRKSCTQLTECRQEKGLLINMRARSLEVVMYRLQKFCVLRVPGLPSHVSR